MDLPCPQWVRHVEQKWTKLGSEGRERFSLLTDINEIFHIALSLIHPEDLDTLSRISDKYSVKKSPDRVSEYREKGNLSFKVKDYTTAALYYSAGICHADKNTEPLSLCYANRSASLFYLGLYNECLEDIRRALEAGYPHHLQDKLITRKTACLSKLENPAAQNNPPPQNQNRSDSTTCTSHGLSVFFSPGKGRHLLATESKVAGDVVLVDKAYSCVLIPGDKLNAETQKPGKTVFDTEDKHCHHCLSQTLSFVPCPSCSYARYCGERCQKVAWDQWHQWECAVGADLLATGVLEHLALRVALRAGQQEVLKAQETSCIEKDHAVENRAGRDSPVRLNFEDHCTKSLDHNDCYHGNSYLGVYSLLPHVEEHSPSSRFLLAVTTAILFKRLQDGPPPGVWASCKDEGVCGTWRPEMSMLGATTLRHMLQLRCNAQAVTAIRVKEESGMTVQSSREIRIATAIFPVLSLLNHSCSPNTSIIFTTGCETDPLPQFCSPEGQGDRPETFQRGVTATVRVSKDLVAGQEILHCYGPHCSRMAVKERQRLLLEQYFFSCRCEACQKEQTEEETKTKNTASGLKCVKCHKPVQSLLERYVCCRPSCGHQITCAEVQKRLQGLQNLLDQAFHLLERERSDEALRILKSASSQADSILTETHPLQGELADAIARAYAITGEWGRAAAHLQRSIVAITVQFGEDSVELGQQLFKLAQLHFNGGDRGAALSVVPEACRLLSLHCGPHCEELQELQEMERYLQ